MVHMSNDYQLHWDALANFGDSTPIEVRFHSNLREDKHYQLLATSGNNGQVYYTLHYNPRGNYSMALTYIVGHDKSDVTLPLKAYSGWQSDVLAWLLSMKHYTVDQVF
jgi:hypothetical protein